MALTAVKLTTRTRAGGHVEFTVPELPAGVELEVSLLPLAPGENAPFTQRFQALTTRWYTETAALSSVSQMAMHPAYQEVIGMGWSAVPLILQELQQQPRHWFWALRAITGEDPLLPEQRGKMEEMTAAWLQWGRERGLLA